MEDVDETIIGLDLKPSTLEAFKFQIKPSMTCQDKLETILYNDYT